MDQFDSDPLRSASHRHMAAHLTAPFAGGAVDSEWAIGADARVHITLNAREPLVLIAPRRMLESEHWSLTAHLDPDGANQALTPAVEFFPYTERGAFLPVYRPPVDPDVRTSSPFVLALALSVTGSDGVSAAIAAAQLKDHLELRLLEGNLGRLIYLLGAEKQRIRRVSREIQAMRTLSRARDDALDRMGAELRVPRFADDLRFDAAKGEIVTVIRADNAGLPVPEPDDEYRRRLRIYRPWRIATGPSLRELLNGLGPDSDPNHGLLGEMGLADRFHLAEADNEFGVAIHLIAAGPASLRSNFLDHIRASRLIWPRTPGPGDAIHAARFLPTSTRQEIEALRTRLAQVFAFNDNAAIAPVLAGVLDRAGKCLAALGVNFAWPVLRTQDSNGGSRYELGLGLDLAPLAAAALDQMHNTLLDPQRPAAGDAEIEALLQSMQSQSAAADPEGAWFLRACGTTTVHRLDAGRIYVSHLPSFGMKITGNHTAAPGARVDLEVRYHAPGDADGNVVLVQGLAEAAARWTGAGQPAFSVLPDAQAAVRWDQAIVTPAAAAAVLQGAGLVGVAQPASVIAQLHSLSPELIDTLLLAAPQAQAILAGQAGAEADLSQLTGLLRDQGISSVLPLVTNANEVLLIVGVVGLPLVGTNLGLRRASGFRWYAVPIQGQPGEIKAVGSRSFFTAPSAGLYALITLGYARRGMTDPYEYRVELPAAARLNLLQYEFLMNLLDRMYPLGVEINTFALRRDNVDLDGDGQPEPLPPTISRTFRRFRRPRLTGEFGVGISGDG